ncbi:MAG: ergothioneine biosynthesis glutamate--cysteine ligase EgtA [Nocardioidaceae bacterium]
MGFVTGDTSTRLRDCAAVRGYVKHVCFKTGPPELVGTELEWLLTFADRPGDVVPIDLLRRLLDEIGPPPRGSTLTFEPGAQLELSSAACRGASACWRALAADVDHVRTPLTEAGLTVLDTAVDPVRAPSRQLQHPRYAAMEAYFASVGCDTGPVMMNSTAATQVNLDVGDSPVEAERRWRLLHDVGPAMVAAFANSPVLAGRRTGWRSTRQWVWQCLDPQRTAAPRGPDPWSGWADYALHARLMLRRGDGEDWSVAPGPTFRDWVEGRLDGPPPTEEDLAYHLTTLFPPVRPRGWFEVRYVDAQPLAWWPVPMAVLAAVLDDPVAGRLASEACADTAQLWETAARDGLADPRLAAAARACFTAARQALPRLGTDPYLVALVEAFADRYVDRGRCPADDHPDPTPEDT